MKSMLLNAFIALALVTGGFFIGYGRGLQQAPPAVVHDKLVLVKPAAPCANAISDHGIYGIDPGFIRSLDGASQPVEAFMNYWAWTRDTNGMNFVSLAVTSEGKTWPTVQ